MSCWLHAGPALVAEDRAHEEPSDPQEDARAALRSALRGDQGPAEDDAYLILMALAERHATPDYINRLASIVIRFAEATRLERLHDLQDAAQRLVAEVVEDEAEAQRQRERERAELQRRKFPQRAPLEPYIWPQVPFRERRMIRPMRPSLGVHAVAAEGPRTQPAVFDSGPVPLGVESAQPYTMSADEQLTANRALMASVRFLPDPPCRGWCERQGRGCERDCDRHEARDSQAAALAVTELQARKARPADRAGTWFGVLLLIVSAVAVAVMVLT